MNRSIETTPDQTDDNSFGNDPNSPQRILVVEDDADLRYLVVRTLSDAGYEVDDAYNGARAWKAIHLKRYALLLTDHEMPELTGLQLIDKLRSARFKLPIILMSGSLLPDIVAKSTWLQTITMLSKPFTLDELRWKVEQLLSAHPAVFNARQGQPTGQVRAKT